MSRFLIACNIKDYHLFQTQSRTPSLMYCFLVIVQLLLLNEFPIKCGSQRMFRVFDVRMIDATPSSHLSLH